MKIAAFLPAKSSSVRLPGKNAKLLNGKPLFLYTLENLCRCSFIDDVYLDTDSEDMAAMAKHLNFHFMRRNAELATNDIDGHALFMNEVDQVDADVYIQAFATSPFVRQETIKEGVRAVVSGELASI